MNFFMYELLPSILNMSLMASYVIIFVLIARLFLRKAPKIFSYVLWIVVLVRLLCPFSFESAISLLPSNTQPIPQGIVHMQNPAVDLPLPSINNAINDKLPKGEEQLVADPLEALVVIATLFWAFGITIMATYSIISLIKLKRKLIGATPFEKNIFVADHIDSPFVIGILKPKIYLPSNINNSEIDFIIMHEKTHIKRFDHITRILAFVTLCVHWFNPFVWIAYTLSAKDMEMSCDDAVINKLGASIKKEYATSLLRFEVQKHLISPLAFSEGDTKSRVKNIMKHKKTKVWVSIVCLVLVGAMAFMLMTNAKYDEQDLSLLNPNMLSNLVYQQSDYITVTAYDGFETEVFHKFIANFLNDSEFERKNMDLSELTPSYAFEIDGVIISLFEHEPHLIKLNFADTDEFRYYTKEYVYNEFTTILANSLIVFEPDYSGIPIPAISVIGEHNTGFYIPNELYEELMFEINISSVFLPTDMMVTDIENYFFIFSNLSSRMIDIVLFVDEDGNPMAIRSKEQEQGLTPISIEMYKKIENVSFPSKVSNASITGYINIKGKQLLVDQVEIILSENNERIEELGLVREIHYPSGYYIHNEINKVEALTLTDETKYIFTDFKQIYTDGSAKLYETISIEEFINGSSYRELDLENLEEKHYIPYFIETNNGIVISITEDFRYTF